MAKTYYEKLKDPKWQKLRLKVMEKNEFCCEVCGDSESTLNVHHKEYIKGLEPWDYEIGQLSCLCESCHEHEHLSVDLLKWAASFFNLDGPNNRTEIAFLVGGYTGADYQGMLNFASIKDCRAYDLAFKAGAVAKQNYLDNLTVGFKNGTR